MITLRGKLTRTLVEAKAATPATTRSNLAPSESAVVTTATQNEATSAIGSAPVESDLIQEMTSQKSTMVEEWLWRGVWAFGSLPEHDGDMLAEAAPSTSMSPANDMQSQTHRQVTEGNIADSQRCVQNLTSKITDVAEATHSHGSTKSSDGINASALIDTHTQTTSSAAHDYLTNTDLEEKPHPFSYRFIKVVDATHVVVPSSLVLHVDYENQDVNAQEKTDNLGRDVENTNHPIESTEKLDDVVKKNAHEVLVSSNANDKQNQYVDATSQDNEQTATNHLNKLPNNDSPNLLSSSIGEVARQNLSHDAKNDYEKPVDCADITQSGDKASPPTQNSEKTTHPTTTAAAVPPPPTAQTNFTSIPNKQTYGDAPYTDAHLTHPLGTCPPGGKWEGHFENIVPNTSNPFKKRKDKKDNRIREMFYLFFNATPPANARTAFVAEDSTCAANDMLMAAGDGDTNESKQEDDSNHLLLPKGRIHVRGFGTNRFGTFEIVGSFDPKNGMLHCQR
ncbi:hypothetical protein ACHAWX_005365 [Stephanocyclus meneghinianus]